eukprot:1023255-Pelagomonas_calceolata.AAC.1
MAKHLGLLWPSSEPLLTGAQPSLPNPSCVDSCTTLYTHVSRVGIVNYCGHGYKRPEPSMHALLGAVAGL